jgi:hypothetical protein
LNTRAAGRLPRIEKIEPKKNQEGGHARRRSDGIGDCQLTFEHWV